MQQISAGSKVVSRGESYKLKLVLILFSQLALFDLDFALYSARAYKHSKYDYLTFLSRIEGVIQKSE